MENEINETDTILDENKEDNQTPKIREIPVLSDKELDSVADTSIEYLQIIISCFELGEITINEYEGADRELILDINGKDLGILIGQHGSTLDAIQQIVGKLSLKKLGFYYPVIIDVEGYKSRQRVKIERMAKSIANRVARQKTKYSMYPMNPYKRKIIHNLLSQDNRVTTKSEGEGSRRHIIVYPVTSN